MPVISRVKNVLNTYPRQFWLISLVMLVAWLLHSMMWSYLMLFSSERLGLPLTSVTWLMTLNAAFGLVTTFVGGAIADKFGRKWVLVFSLLLAGISWYYFRSAFSMPVFALLIALTGAATPLYRLVADAMVADLVPEADRLNAYSVLRMGNNLGVALGPAIGGWLVARSYNTTFTVIGVGFVLIGIFSAVLSAETRPAAEDDREREAPLVGGYLEIFKDRLFLVMVAGLSLNRIATSVLWVLLAAYSKQNYGLSEGIYGFIPATNAVMVVLFQLLVSRKVSRHNPNAAMALGALIYAVSIFSVSFFNGFWGFWLCMVGSTVGEMILVPTATTAISRMAPAHMRARYMSSYTLAIAIGTGVGPLVGGWAEALFNPRAMWYAAGLFGFLGTCVLFYFSQVKKNSRAISTAQAGEA